MSSLEEQIKAENTKEIERQLERLSFFSQNGLTTQANRFNELESVLYGLINTLIAGGLINDRKLQKITSLVKENMKEKGEQHAIGILINAPDDPNEEAPTLPMVNCDERLHICKAVCCQMKFALTAEEIEAGTIKWDLGLPYQIRQGKDSYCTHIDKDKKCCTIYDDRPKVCHKFNCTNDKRIWNDFEKMELNHDWIKENITKKEVKFMK